MAGETELERLVIRLIGDAADYKKMLKDAEQATKDAANKIEEASKNMSGAIVAQGMIAARAMEELGQKLYGFAMSAVAGFAEAEMAETKLRAALEAHGRPVDALTEDYKAFALALQATSTIEDDTTIAMLAQAEAMGVSGEAAKRAVKEAAALAAQWGGSAEGYIRQTIMLSQGNVGRLGRLLGLGDAEGPEKVALAHKKLAEMQAGVTAETKTLEGAWKQLQNSWGNAKETLGEFASVFKPLIIGIKGMLDAFQQLNPEIRGTIAAVVGLLAAFPVLLASVATLKIVIGFLASGWATLASVIPAVVAGFAAMGAPVILVVTAMIAVGAALSTLLSYGESYINQVSGMTDATNELNAALARSAELDKEWQKMHGKRTTELVATGAGIKDKGAQDKFFESQIKSASDAVKVYEQDLKDANAELEAQDTWWNRLKEDSWKAEGSPEALAAKARIASVTGQIAAQKEQVEKLKEAQQAASEQGIHKAAIKDMDELQKKLETQLATRGMTADQVEVYKLKLRGVSDAELANVAGLAAMIAAKKKADDEAEKASEKAKDDAKELLNIVNKAEDQSAARRGMSEGQKQAEAAGKVGADRDVQAWIQEMYDAADAEKKAKDEADNLRNSIDSMTDGLIRQIATFDMTSAEAEIYNLKKQGASATDVKFAEGLQKQLKGMQDHKKALEDGKSLMEKYATPAEKLAKEQATLANLLKEKAITIDIYNKALADAEKQANKDYQADFKVEGVEAVIAGSAAAAKAWDAYVAGTQGVDMKNLKPQAGLAPSATGQGGLGLIPEAIERGMPVGIESKDEDASTEYLKEMVDIAKAYWKGTPVTLSQAEMTA